MKKKVVITGGSGLLGRDVIKEFIDHGYEVLNVDRQYPKEALCRTVITDLTNLGEVYGVASRKCGFTTLSCFHC